MVYNVYVLKDEMVRYTHVAVCSLARSLPAKGHNSPPCLSGAPEERLSPCPGCSRRRATRLWASQAPPIPHRPGSISPPPLNESQQRFNSVVPLTPVKSPSHLEQKQVHPQTPATQIPPTSRNSVRKYLLQRAYCSR